MPVTTLKSVLGKTIVLLQADKCVIPFSETSKLEKLTKEKSTQPPSSLQPC